MKRFSVYCACVALSLAFQAEVFFQAEAQDFKYDWSVIPVTDKYDLPAGTPVAEICFRQRTASAAACFFAALLETFRKRL